METQDFRTFSQLSTALFSDPNESSEASKQALSHAALKRLNDRDTIEDAALQLIDQALTKGQKANANAIHDPFYRLSAEERFILVALHSGQWNYPKIARALRIEVPDVETLAWSARLTLSQGRMTPLQYPAGSTVFAVDCPEYAPYAPWTQRFLDEEINASQRLFLQHHLMSCQSCRNTLSACREVYYAAQKMLPEFQKNSRLDLMAHGLEKTWNLTQRYLHPTQNQVRLSFRRLFRSRDFQIVLLIGIALILYKALSSS